MSIYVDICRKNDTEELTVVLKALSHPHRLQIFIKLAKLCTTDACKTEEETTACVGEAGKGLDTVPSTLSHHIKELKNAGLLKLEKSGQKSVCSVDKKSIEKLQKFFNSLGDCK